MPKAHNPNNKERRPIAARRARAWKAYGLRPFPWKAYGLRFAHRLAGRKAPPASLSTGFPQDPRAHRPCGPAHRLSTPSGFAWRPLCGLHTAHFRSKAASSWIFSFLLRIQKY